MASFLNEKPENLQDLMSGVKNQSLKAKEEFRTIVLHSLPFVFFHFLFKKIRKRFVNEIRLEPFLRRNKFYLRAIDIGKGEKLTPKCSPHFLRLLSECLHNRWEDRKGLDPSIFPQCLASNGSNSFLISWYKEASASTC